MATSAIEALGPLVPGGRVVLLSKGAVDLLDIVIHLLNVAGPAAVSVMSWTIGTREIATLHELVMGGAIRSLRLMIDASFPSRNGAYAEQLRASFSAGCVRLAICHAKVATVVNEGWGFVVLSSANLNRASRIEFYSVEDNRLLATQINDTLQEWFTEPASDQWDVPMAEHTRRFAAWGVTADGPSPAPSGLDADLARFALMPGEESELLASLGGPEALL